MTSCISFHVPGTPAPQGSKSYLGHGRMVESSKRVKPWRTDVRAEAMRHFERPLHGPIRLDLTFLFPRPASHLGTGRNAGRLKPSAPPEHTRKPDADKLARAILDALTGVVYVDDSQVIVLVTYKRWAEVGDRPGARVSVVAIEEVDA